MKLKNILMILFLNFFTIIGCLAVEISVENPYQDIAIKSESKFKQENCASSLQCHLRDETTSFKPIFGNINRRDYGEASIFSFAVFLKANKQLLTQRSYDATTPTLPGGRIFEESFSMNGKEGQIVYKAEAEFSEILNQKAISAIKIKVLKATLDGVELPKQGIKADL